MASLNIEYDEDIYEGKLYGWRWFVAIHGIWQVAPPMFSVRRSRENRRFELMATSDGDRYFELLHDYFDRIDLLDWNQADHPPNLPRVTTKRSYAIITLPTGHCSGYHLFANYRDAVNYALIPYTVKKEGVSLPPTFRAEFPEHLSEHFKDPMKPSLKVTPLLAFVEASGAIVEHEKGYRAHLIRIVSLYSDGRKRARQELADNIGWPGVIHKYRKLRNMKNPSDTNLRRLDCD